MRANRGGLFAPTDAAGFAEYLPLISETQTSIHDGSVRSENRISIRTNLWNAADDHLSMMVRVFCIENRPVVLRVYRRESAVKDS